MKVLKHLFAQPFLAAVSLAAITHSTWSFATFFGGLEPHPQFDLSWWAWMLPGLFLAFSIDVGLLSMANEIRDGNRAPTTLLAFVVLCLAMCYAQFVYIVSHIPSVTVAAGVRVEWLPTVTLFRDASIFVFPALLPIALILFAFKSAQQPRSTDHAEPLLAVNEQPALTQFQAALAEPTLEVLQASCPSCHRVFEATSPDKLQRALWGHQPHCAALGASTLTATGK